MNTGLADLGGGIGGAISETVLSATSEEEKNAILEVLQENLVRNIYAFCRETIEEIVSKADSEDEDDMAREWQKVRSRLDAWEGELSVMDGRLDRMFIETRLEHLLEPTCIVLCGIAGSLSQSLHPVGPPWSYKEILGELAEAMVARMPSTQDYLEVPFRQSYGDVRKWLHDVRIAIKCLYELLSVTKNWFLEFYSQTLEAVRPNLLNVACDAHEKILSAEGNIYRGEIYDKFPDMPNDLALHLAHLNSKPWLRLKSPKLQGLGLSSLQNPLDSGVAPSELPCNRGAEEQGNTGNPDPRYDVSATSPTLKANVQQIFDSAVEPDCGIIKNGNESPDPRTHNDSESPGPALCLEDNTLIEPSELGRLSLQDPEQVEEQTYQPSDDGSR